MVRRSFLALFAVCLTGVGLLTTSSDDSLIAATKPAKKKPITNPKYDPNAEEIELFAAMEAGQVDVKLIPKNAFGGTVFIENKTDKPLNVKIPEAVVAAPINAQIGMGGMGMGGGMGGMGGGMGGMGGGMGGGQQMMGGGMGGGMGGMGGGMGGMGGGMGGMGGGGFFSVPPERVVAVKFNSVCLQHGRPDPTAGNKYRLLPVSRVSKDPVLYELLSSIGSGRVDSQAAQAAAWSISDKMSWQQLANKAVDHLGGQPSTPYFTQEELLAGQQLLAMATERAATKKEEAPATPTPAKTQPRTARAVELTK